MDRQTDGQTDRKEDLLASSKQTGGCRAGRQTDGVTGVTVGQAASWTDLQTDRLGLRLFNVLIKEVFLS